MTTEIRSFYTHLLDLAWPWTVKSAVFGEETESVEVHIECEKPARLPCPLCGRTCPISDYSPVKTWRHLDTCHKTTHLHAKLPVVYCSEHGEQLPDPPWGSADSPATLAFERLVARLAAGRSGIKKLAEILRLDPVEVRSILQGMTERAEKGEDRPESKPPSTSRRPPAPQTRQLSLFERNDLSYVNQGIQAFQSLELEKAIALFQKHRSVYPKGSNIEPRIAAADFLLQGLREAPADPSLRPAYLCRLWNSFEDYVESEPIGRPAFAAEARHAFFTRIIEELDRLSSTDSALMPGNIPLGYILLQAGRYDEAIQSLQSCIPASPRNAALYGYLGDAYLLRGDRKVARQCYREGCLIGPASIDWRHLEDEDLKELKQQMLVEYGPSPDLALAWLPSHARIEGLFAPKLVTIDDGLEQMVDDYLALEKALPTLPEEELPLLAANLFFRGMILCENRHNLKYIKKIDLSHVRKLMQQANPELFEEFLERVVEGEGKGEAPSR